MKRLIAATLFMAAYAIAQDPNSVIALPIIRQSWDELRQYLVLSQAQIDALQQIMNNRSQEEQTLYRQMAEKERQLYGLLDQGSNDSGTIGALMVEINNLRKKLPTISRPYRAPALAVLNDAQKAKLTALGEALKLQTPGWQAVQLNLIDGPPMPDSRILPQPLITTMSGTEPSVAWKQR